MWEMPIYKPPVESGRSVLRGKFLFTNLRSHFAWEIPIYKLNLLLGGAFRAGNFIYKLNWSVSCGKFLFTNSTSVFSLFTNYLQTYLQTSLVREEAFSRRAIRGLKSFNQTLDFYMPVPENSFFP